MTASAVRFDMFLWQIVPWEAMREDARYLESLDIGTIWIGDRYLMPPVYGGDVLEAWATLSALAVCTERVRLGTMVTDVSLRHPAMLAKQAAAVDRISGGRLDLGVGPGDNIAEEIKALGMPSLPGEARVQRLREAVEIIDGLLRGQRVTFEGAYYQLEDAPLAPLPVQQPRPPLMIAAQGKKGLQLVTERADIWVSALWAATADQGVESVRERNRILDECCAAIDRDPTSIERACFIGWSDCEAPFASRDAFQDFMGRYRDAGVQRFVFCLGGPRTPDPYSKWVKSGSWADREAMEAFARREMSAAQSSS
jgi:alkanesulfonate monooxygenase SsuD/methylene tetrahydromethanopterin reductase-like flavin-dependent oxidoreductase (luciferase family)